MSGRAGATATMDDRPSNFRIDTGDYLGIKHASFKDDMLAMALAEPSKYFAMRKLVLEKVKAEAVAQQFNIYYNLLTKGTNASKQSILQGTPFEDMFVPCYPAQLTSEFALGAAKTIDKIAEEAVDILLPKDYKSLASDRLIRTAEGKMSI